MTPATEFPEAQFVSLIDSVLELASGFMAAKCLFAASDLGLFELLAKGPATLQRLSESLNVSFFRMRILLNAVCALGLVERCSAGYQNSAAVTTFLTRSSVFDLRPLLSSWNSMNYPLWTRFESAFRTGRGYGRPALDAESQRVYSEGVAAFGSIDAMALPRCYDFERHSRLLDLGGGTGLWTKSILSVNPHLHATLLEFQGTAAVASDDLRDGIAGDRVAVMTGDFFHDAIPTGHDVMLIANVAHGFSAAQNVELLRRVRAAASRGARLLWVDLWIPDSAIPPRLSALLACTFMVSTGEGGTYEIREAVSWAMDTGWSFIDWFTLPHAASTIVCEAA